MQKTIKAQLEEIAKDGATTEKQRELIRKQSLKMGVVFNERTGCGDCYRDQAVVLWRILCEKEIKSTAQYALRGGVDVVWRGVRINATRSEDELQRFLQAGFPREFFRVIDGKRV